ncbi:UNVERIFIED_CONTAM: hypothetical protein FKN15_020071 [Acipenser sinensis]
MASDSYYGIAFRPLRQPIHRAVSKDGETLDVGPQFISTQGDSSNGTAPGSLQEGFHLSLSSPRKCPEGLRPQTHPFTQHQLQYWHNCTSDSWMLAIVHSGYTLQFCKGPPPFRGIMVTSVKYPFQVLALRQEVDTLLLKQAISLV